MEYVLECGMSTNESLPTLARSAENLGVNKIAFKSLGFKFVFQCLIYVNKSGIDNDQTNKKRNKFHTTNLQYAIHV